MPSEESRRRAKQHNVGWTILRPTLIYAEGRDTNITPLSRLIRRFGFMPLVGGAPGLRQPVHAEDLAIGAIAAASSPAAINKFYSLPGAETLTYREMIGRIFDGLRMPRRTHPGAAVAVAGRLRAGETAVSRRQCRDGHPHDEGHDLRFHARRPRFRLESEGLQSEVRLNADRQSMNTTVLRPLRITRSSR